jgi:hypothetical protein
LLGLVGGGGANVDWDVAGGIGYSFNAKVSAVAGYRALGVDYSNDGFVFDVVQRADRRRGHAFLNSNASVITSWTKGGLAVGRHSLFRLSHHTFPPSPDRRLAKKFSKPQALVTVPQCASRREQQFKSAILAPAWERG